MSLLKNVSNNGKNWDALVRTCKETLCDVLKLIKVIDTQWNSHAMCLLHILELQPAVDRLCIDWTLNLELFMFTRTEWSIVQDLEAILQVSRYFICCASSGRLVI